MKDDFWNEFRLEITMFTDQPYDEIEEEKNAYLISNLGFYNNIV